MKHPEGMWPPARLFFPLFQRVTTLGSLVIHTKHSEKTSSLIKVYLHFRAAKLPIKKQNFHRYIAMISLVADPNFCVAFKTSN